jgi:hypothetical protein
MMVLRAAAMLAALLALASCETLTPDECRSADWYQIGVADGAEGRGTDRIELHRRACAEVGVSPDAAAWLRGRTAGLRQYCTPARAYEVGRRGGQIAAGCTADELVAMRPAHRWGETWWQIGLEISEVESDIRAAEAELRRLPAGAGAEAARLRREIGRLEARLMLLRADQRRYASWPP